MESSRLERYAVFAEHRTTACTLVHDGTTLTKDVIAAGPLSQSKLFAWEPNPKMSSLCGQSPKTLLRYRHARIAMPTTHDSRWSIR